MLEVLVVLSIALLLLGLLIPVVQRVRAVAQRSACQNRLRQIGLGLHQYHDTRGALPPAFSLHGLQYLSWMGRLLPFTEEQSLWQEATAAYLADSWPWRNPPHPTDTVVSLFTCPSDGRVRQAVNPSNIFTVLQGGSGLLDLHLTVALTSYLGVSGTDLHARDGVLYVDSRIRLTDIKDGLSKTVMVGERPPGADFAYGWWYAGPGQDLTGSADVVLGAKERNVVGLDGCPGGPYAFGPGSLENPCDVFHFWSLHPGGANFVFADASVRFLRYSAAGVLPALATRDGREAVSLED
jgi:prepilin-type processing-associated H-X9-DG protein